MRALAADSVVDPIYGLRVSKDELIDHVVEDFLTEEEVRINCANKTTHTVYNSMPFPDSAIKPVRTITATCTRVSRESIVIEHPGSPVRYRRLTVRERASLQGFPITYQFYGRNYSQKLKMIGNAVPPVSSYLIASAIVGTAPGDLLPLTTMASKIDQPRPAPKDTPPEKLARRYQLNRSFRFAIPSLRMKSGVRFELSNRDTSECRAWEVRLFYGSSKKILSIPLEGSLYDEIISAIPSPATQQVHAPLSEFWAHKGPGLTKPFMLLDQLDKAGAALTEAFSLVPFSDELVKAIVIARSALENDPEFGVRKLEANAPKVLAGMLIGSWFNEMLGSRTFDAHERRAC